MARLPAVFDSGFCFVTGAFRFSGADFAAALDDDLTFDAVALAAVLGAAFAALAVAALLGAFARPVGWTTAFFCTAGLAADLLAAVLATADFKFFPVEVVFAGFFIAFAWNQYQLWIALVARMDLRMLSRQKLRTHCMGFARAIFLKLSPWNLIRQTNFSKALNQKLLIISHGAMLLYFQPLPAVLCCPNFSLASA